MSIPFPRFIDHFAAFSQRYDLLLSDVWGVVHNGVAAFPEACDALARFRSPMRRARTKSWWVSSTS
jgi:hypothetical protein